VDIVRATPMKPAGSSARGSGDYFRRVTKVQSAQHVEERADDGGERLRNLVPVDEVVGVEIESGQSTLTRPDPVFAFLAVTPALDRCPFPGATPRPVRSPELFHRWSPSGMLGQNHEGAETPDSLQNHSITRLTGTPRGVRMGPPECITGASYLSRKAP
jgi:hypothetical protein